MEKKMTVIMLGAFQSGMSRCHVHLDDNEHA